VFMCLVACQNNKASKEVLSATSLSSNTGEQPYVYGFNITELTDQDYPDNPDIGFRSESYTSNYFGEGQLVLKDSNLFDVEFFTTDGKDKIILPAIDLMEFIPTIPEHIKSDEYLKKIAVINQEWNRNQVRFKAGEFKAPDSSISRVDLARNCLNAYLWEIIVYTTDSGKELPIYHGWFNFPETLYAELFKKRNGVDYNKYQEDLEQWIDPAHKKVNKALLRTVVNQLPTKFTDKSYEMYPLKQARKKKFKEIIFPKIVTKMSDFHTDSTLFATFSQPGFYNRKDPRTTELGRLQILDTIFTKTIISTVADASTDTLFEFELVFKDTLKQRTTHLVLGGINKYSFPVLVPKDANAGWKSSMGISNHTFYETYEEHENVSSKENPYYAYLTNEKGEWLDSHTIGIDGPIFHWGKGEKNVLHLWLLSFERHALVGHYTMDFGN